MTERMTIAKTEITMLFRWSVSLYSVILPRDRDEGVEMMQGGWEDQPRPCLHYSYDGLHIGGYMREVPKSMMSRRWMGSVA